MALKELQRENIRGVEADTKILLEQWGRWASQNVMRSLAFKSSSPFRNLYVLPGDQADTASHTSKFGWHISDDLAVAIDKKIASLIQRDRQMGLVMSTYYLHGCNVVRVTELMNESRYRATMLIEAGTMWIDCALYGSEEHF